MPKIVHFEIPADDLKRAQQFYGDLFGWEIKPQEGAEEYLMISSNEENGVEGGILKRRAPDQPITHYVDVDSVDDYTRKVAALKGEIIAPKMPVPKKGYFAICKDTENNIFGIWEEDPEAGFFQDAAEVFVALILTVIASDGEYSVDEMQFVWNDVEALEIFEGREYKSIENKLMTLFKKDVKNMTPFTDEQIQMILSSAQKMLDAKIQEKAYETALNMAHADKNLEGYHLDIDEREQTLLDRIQAVFEISPEKVKEMIDEMKRKRIS